MTARRTIDTVTSVLQGEGFASAGRRALERISEGARNAALRVQSGFTSPAAAAILNVIADPFTARLGGTQTQLIERLEAERSLRTVALLHPGGLFESSPRPNLRRLDPDLVVAIRRALESTGARAVHFEGMHHVPLEPVLRLAGEGVPIVISLMDFALFCARPHLVELPAERFCFYSEDLDRCERCLRQTWDLSRDDQVARRAQARELLAAAAAVIAPSEFLLEQHRALFSLPLAHGTVIEIGSKPFARPVAPRAEARAIAYAGSVQPHKGAHLLPQMMRGKAPWHIFGGGQRELLRTIRQIPNATVHGYYRQGELPSLLARHGVGLVVLPSIWPETFSLVLSEAWLAGATVVAFDIGAPAERIRAHGGGYLVPLEAGAEGMAALVEEWSSGRLPAATAPALRSPSDAAGEQVALYRSLKLL